MNACVRTLRRVLMATIIVGCHWVCLAGPAGAAEPQRFEDLFANPPREYSTAPLWVWNDMLTEEQVVSSLRDLAAQNVKQAFVHPRPGLMTPYLSDGWFRLWKAALKEAGRLDMNLWIYDENSYPSGFAGGWVPEMMPESRGRGLATRTDKVPPNWDGTMVAVFRVKDGGCEDVTREVRRGQTLGGGEYLTFFVRRASNSPWHGDRCYVDLLYPGVTQKFLETTLGAYAREIGAEFGKRVPGSFTDEPELRPAGGLAWTEDLPRQFEKKWGYTLPDRLASLSRAAGDWKRVRHNYYQTLLDLFVERWGRPYYDYCQAHNLEFTGHYWEHEWPRCTSVPDNMAMAAWQHRPGIDILMNEYQEDVHAQFGNARSVKEVASIANQLGRRRTLCEAYGAGGWDLRFEDMKRIGDWIYVLGINTMDQHLSYITLRGARKADHPQSFSYHEPWWDSYHVMGGYFTRLSAALSAGQQINSILVIEPTTTAWMYNTEAGNDPQLAKLGSEFQKLVVDLEARQVEYDLGCEDVMARHGAARGNALIVGRRSYTTVVLPPLAENLNRETMELLEKYVKGGGVVLCCGESPARVSGRVSDRGQSLAKRPGWRRVEAGAVAEVLAGMPADVVIRREVADKGKLFHHRRQLADRQIVFLVNTSIDSPSSGMIEAKVGSVEQADPYTGAIRAYPFEAAGGAVRARFTLPPSGSLLLVLAQELKGATPGVAGTVAAVAPAGEISAKRIGPNVLTLDYVDITAGGETRAGMYFYQANQFAFQKNGMERNPWDSAVQFRDELISRKFPAGSGFEATYRFNIAEAVPGSLSVVVERPDLYTVTCNGKAVSAAKGAWWLDKAFGRIDIASVAKVGENTVTIKASPFTIYHELEPAYVLGDFALRAGDKGFAIVPDSGLKLGAWSEQGCPFYAQGVAYTQAFDVSAAVGQYRVTLPKWYGSVAKVSVNGQLAGHVVSAPWGCDVSRYIKPGRNTIEVTVVGTLKNTLGPHHGNPPVGRAWPAMFHQGPAGGPPAGGKYSVVGYGLMAPFGLERME